jgi:hypothetical protein
MGLIVGWIKGDVCGRKGMPKAIGIVGSVEVVGPDVDVHG